MSRISVSFYRDVLPIMVMVGIEISDTGLFTLFKAATLRGMSNHVFVAYAYAIATIIQLPSIFYSKRFGKFSVLPRMVPPLSFSILSKIILLGVVGSSSQILGYAGINHSSPTLATSIGNLVPAFTFLLAVIFRMEKVAAKSRSSQAKVIGSIVSIAGAFVLTFYKGPSINSDQTNVSLPLQKQTRILNSADSSWAIAGIFLTADYLLVSLWYILQVEILKVYPDELSIVFYYNVTSTIVSVTVALFTEPNESAWKIGVDISLISIICSGILGKFISNVVYAWALHLKGPVYVASFKPLAIVVAVAMGVMFLGDALHIGSIIGAIIISIGLYIVLWGKATEETEEDIGGNDESPTTDNAPLLQSYNKFVNSEKNSNENMI